MCVCVQDGEGLSWKELLRIKSPHKLLYALEIIEALGKPNRRIHRESTVSETHHAYFQEVQLIRMKADQ